MKKRLFRVFSMIIAVCLLIDSRMILVEAETCITHSYQATTITKPTCNSEGTFNYDCSVCNTASGTIDSSKLVSLTHTDLAVAKLVWRASQKYHILNMGMENMTPFKFLDFGEK